MIEADKTLEGVQRLRERLGELEFTPATGAVVEQARQAMLDAQILLRDLVDAADELALPPAESGSPMARLIASNAVLRRQLNNELDSRDFRTDWWAARCERVRALLKPTPYWHDYAAIIANGTVDVHENPTYQQRLAMASHRVEVAEQKVAMVVRCWRKLKHGNVEQKAAATATLDELLEKTDAGQ